MNAGHFLTILCGSMLLSAGCQRQCKVDGDITPGCGVLLDGTAIRVGDPLIQVEEAAGSAPQQRQLSTAEGYFFLDEAGVAGTFDNQAEGSPLTQVRLVQGFTGQTTSGVGLGTGQDDTRSALGEAQTEPFLGTWWYPALGLGLEWQEGVVSAVMVFAVVEP